MSYFPPTTVGDGRNQGRQFPDPERYHLRVNRTHQVWTNHQYTKDSTSRRKEDDPNRSKRPQTGIKEVERVTKGLPSPRVGKRV